MSENWEAFYHNDRHWVVHTDTALIADCFNTPNSEKNAKLIAAAPELYNMLRYMLGYVREWEAISTGRIYKAKVQKDIRNAEALLRRIDREEDGHE